MTTYTYYVLAFALTVIVAIFMFVLATVVFLRGKREYLNISGGRNGILLSPNKARMMFQ